MADAEDPASRIPAQEREGWEGVCVCVHVCAHVCVSVCVCVHVHYNLLLARSRNNSPTPLFCLAEV